MRQILSATLAATVIAGLGYGYVAFMQDKATSTEAPVTVAETTAAPSAVTENSTTATATSTAAPTGTGSPLNIQTPEKLTPVTVPAELKTENDPIFDHASTERSIGSPTAPVVFHEYFSLTCSHCGHFHKVVLPELKTAYIDTGKLRIVYHDFPFDQIGVRAAMAARCLPTEKYQTFIGTLFDTQNAWVQSEQVLMQMAGFAGQSQVEFNACVTNPRLIEYMLNSRVKANNDLQVNSTPTFIIEGSLERVVGAQTVADFKAAIDRQLARVGAQ